MSDGVRVSRFRASALPLILSGAASAPWLFVQLDRKSQGADATPLREKRIKTSLRSREQQVVNSAQPRNVNPYTQRPILSVTAFVVILWIVAWIGLERHLAEREYAAYHRLRALGATGDDWISFKEMITGRPPIVQIDIPATVPFDTALESLADMGNVESITLHRASISNEESNALKRFEKRVKPSSRRFIRVVLTDADKK